MRVYLDHNATTTTRPEAIAAIAETLATVGNPSSVHADGRGKRRLVEEARAKIARLVGAQPSGVVFTSGGTEASNLALSSSIRDPRDPRPVTRLIASAIEHPAVLAGARFSADAVTIAPVTAAGLIDLAALERALAEHAAAHPGKRAILALMLANNETGVIQPVADAVALAKRYGALVHVDAVQAVGKIPVALDALGCDFLALAAHKFGGPAGVGALVRRDEGIHVDEAVVRGGGQEKGWRGGTENVAGIVGLGVAAEAAGRDLEAFARLAEQRDRLEAGVKALGPVTIFGAEAPRLPNTSCFADPRVSSSSAMIALDLAGVSVSSGSACSSGKAKASPVLDAMGVTHDLSNGMLRASFGWSSGPNDAETFLAAWSGIVKRIVAHANAA
ncbi:cysteine desulfurase family protein [Methylopila sp. Yamaguchi]|uniref:cysteine desulfurase family protein n=1 Tax=Methylopila sp. Yamaguchi TaxID=1437817 RepID=UPI000CC1BFF6|nr:cysteine desulfurase family protein [Methylopila sp. Yamaguchi]GBD49320.1 class V aminotransferase [Methylopila sp. Yamaguchi]